MLYICSLTGLFFSSKTTKRLLFWSHSLLHLYIYLAIYVQESPLNQTYLNTMKLIIEYCFDVFLDMHCRQLLEESIAWWDWFSVYTLTDLLQMPLLSWSRLVLMATFTCVFTFSLEVVWLMVWVSLYKWEIDFILPYFF